MSSPVAALWRDILSASGDRAPVVLLDGGSGSGKTTLAHELIATAPIAARLVSLDSCYPGWDGLAEGSRMVVDDVLRAEAPGHWTWDWERDERATWQPLELPSGAALVVEGCGALTFASRALATYAIWLELGADARRARALGRDGDTFAPHWERWAAQERAHWRRHRPWELADVVIGPLIDVGSAGVPC